MKLLYSLLLIFLGLIVIQFTVGWYAVNFSNDISNLLDIKSSTTNILIFLEVIFFVYLLLTAYILKELILDPVEKLNEAIKKVSKGNLRIKLETSKSDEFSELAKSFNKMTQDLKNSTKDIRKRTKEVEEKNVELEKINTLTVERELKMIEMKKKYQK